MKKTKIKSLEGEAMKEKRCKCGGIIFADTEDWDEPICYFCYEKLDSVKNKNKKDNIFADALKIANVRPSDYRSDY